ncbi:MAG: RlmE family RNA methyltransferase [Pseudomonadota bacterium]
MAKRSKSSDRWLQRQRRDVFARKAREDGLTSRAHFKLAQLDKRFKLLRRGQCVLELGAAPGGWSRYVADRIDPGVLVAVDTRPITAPGWVARIVGEAGEVDTDAAIAAALQTRRCDLVFSDMAPNISGVRAADQAASMGLADVAARAALSWLKPGGALVVKLFQGEGVDDWLAQRRTEYARARLVKPAASRPDSRELFAVCLQRGTRGGA